MSGLVDYSIKTPENKITEIPSYFDKASIDSHMEKMNREGFELITVTEVVRGSSPSGEKDFKLFWKRVSWPQ